MRAETGSLKERLASLKDGRQREMGELEDRIAELQLQLDEVGVVDDIRDDEEGGGIGG